MRSRPIRRGAGLFLAAGLCASVAGLAPSAPATAGPRHPATPGWAGVPLPERIGAPPAVLQMVTVTSPRWGSTTGTLRAWQRPRGGSWRRVHGPLPVVLGYAGWVRADRRLQNSGTTPAGRFRLRTAFGLQPDPGTALSYHHVDGNDWWPYEPRDPATYNVYQPHKDPRTHWRPTYAEHLADYPTQYAYAVVVGFNLPSGVHYSAKRNQRVADDPADTRRGGGIFLHVRGSGATAGCVAMARLQMRWLIRWLDPARRPQVAMGPYRYVRTL